MSNVNYYETVNEEDKKLENSERVLTFGGFEHFSEEIKIFIEKVFLPFMDENLLPEMTNDLIDSEDASSGVNLTI